MKKEQTEKQKKNWFKKGHKLSKESIQKMVRSKTKLTQEERAEKEKNRHKTPSRIEWTKQYAKSPKRKFDTYKRSASSKLLDFNISFEEFNLFWQKPCEYCNSEIETIGLDRVDNNFGYEMDNVVPCCKLCNYMKRNMNEGNFLAHCEKVVAYQILKPLK